MSKFRWIALLLLCSMSGYLFLTGGSEEKAHAISPPPLRQVQALSELCVLKVANSTIVETKVTGYLGSQRLLAIIHASQIWSCDLSKVSYQSVDTMNKRVEVALPQPRISEVVLENGQGNSYLFLRNGLWRVYPSDAAEETLLTQCHQQIRQVFMQGHRGIEQSRQRVEMILGDFYRQAGWSLEIVWD